MSKARFILAAALILSIASGITFAMIAKENTLSQKGRLTFGDVAAEIFFEKDADETAVLYPGICLAMSPMVRNSGLNSAYVYLRVTVPVLEVRDSTLQVDERELFAYDTGVDWEFMDASNGTHVYAYHKELAPGESTATSLFDMIKYADVLQGEINESRLGVLVEAMAVQSGNVSDLSAAYQFLK